MTLETLLNAGLFGVCAYFVIRFAGWLARDDDRRRPYDWEDEAPETTTTQGEK